MFRNYALVIAALVIACAPEITHAELVLVEASIIPKTGHEPGSADVDISFFVENNPESPPMDVTITPSLKFTLIRGDSEFPKEPLLIIFPPITTVPRLAPAQKVLFITQLQAPTSNEIDDPGQSSLYRVDMSFVWTAISPTLPPPPFPPITDSGAGQALNSGITITIYDVPEPSTAAVAVIGVVCGLAYGWTRHRRDQRRPRPVGPPNATD